VNLPFQLSGVQRFRLRAQRGWRRLAQLLVDEQLFGPERPPSAPSTGTPIKTKIHLLRDNRDPLFVFIFFLSRQNRAA